MTRLQDLVDRDAAADREQRVFGIVTAIVSSINDDGTYQLEYLSMGEDDVSAPARVMMPMAGARRGMHFMPEPGDEVIVAFEHGDTNLPVILGAVWNENDQPPSQAQPSPRNNVRTIVSRSGHEITLDDTPGRGKITIKTAGGRQLELDDTPPGRVLLQSATGGAVEISDAAGTLTIRAPGGINLESPNIGIQTGGSVSIEATGIQLTTTGSAPLSTVVIDGKPFGAHVHTLAGTTTGPVAP